MAGSTAVGVPGLSALLDEPPPELVIGPSGRTYSGNSLGCMRVHQLPRRLAINLVESPLFDPFILITILCNCGTLAWTSPLDPLGTWKADFLELAEWIFLGIFSAELIVKVIAFGLFSDAHAYLRDPWCQLDVFVVIVAWLPHIFTTMGNYTAIRTLRALRPLRTLRHVPGMPALIDCIFSAIPGLSSVASLCALLLVILAIVGVQLFKGALHYRCTNPYGGSLVVAEQDDHGRALKGASHGASGSGFDRFCSSELKGDVNACAGGMYGSCERNFEADGIGHPKYSAFDSASAASMTILRTVTFDSWTEVMYGLMDSVSSTAWTYFIATVVLGGFFIVNLFLAVLFDEFSRSMAINSKVIARLAKTDDSPAKKAPEATAAHAKPMGVAESALKPIVQHVWFERLSLTMIFLNLVITCLKYEGQPASQRASLERANRFFTVYVIIEIIISIVGHSWHGFWNGVNKDWAAFDFGVLIVSSLDLILSMLFPEGTAHNLVALRVLRAVRALRFLRTAKHWKALARALDALRIGGQNLLNLLLLLLLFIFIFAVAGMQLFAGRCDNESRYFFDFASVSMLTTFSIFVGDWVDTRVACTITEDGSTSFVSDFFFVFTLLLGFFVLVNLFIAVLFHAFSTAERHDGVSKAMEAAVKGMSSEERSEEVARTDGADDEGSGDPDILVHDVQSPSFWRQDFTRDQYTLRAASAELVRHPTFEKAILALIVLSMVCLAVDTPRLDPHGKLSIALVTMNYVFVVAFTAEMLLKMYAFGICKYFASGWNCLDSTIVGISIASLFPSLPSNLSALRLLRVLRPLRLLSRIPGMKIIFLFAITCVVNIMQVVCVVGFIQVVYSVLGMELFSGTFASCTDPSLSTRAACTASQANGTAVLWLNPPFGSFDNVLSANLLLFVASTTDSWEDFMFMTMDAVGNGIAPVRQDSSLNSLYFVFWCLIGAFGTLNLLVGTVVDSFNRIAGNSDSGNGGMTMAQRQWRHVQITSYSMAKAVEKPVQPEHPIRRNLHGLVTSVAFDSFISMWVLCNVLLMGFDYEGIEQNPADMVFLERGLTIFTSVYYVECILKLLGLGVSVYFGDNWCRFDFTLVCLALLEDFAESLLDSFLPVPPMMFRILRVLRVLRLIRLLKNAKGIQDLIMTLVISFPALLNVIALLLLTIFIYGVLGVNLFTFTKHGNQINDDRNFYSVGSASLVLLQALTNDQWSVIMDDLMIGPERGCNPNANPSDCGSRLLPVAYFFSFLIICQFVLLNIVVAVVLDNFKELRDWNPKLCSEHDIQDFADKWSDFDPKALGVLSLDACAQLVLSLPAPLGLRDSVDASGNVYDIMMASSFLKELDLPLTDSEELMFQDLLNALIVKSFENELVSAPEELLASLQERRTLSPTTSFKRRSLTSIEQLANSSFTNKTDDSFSRAPSWQVTSTVYPAKKRSVIDTMELL